MEEQIKYDKTRPGLDTLSKFTTPLRLSPRNFVGGCCGDSIGSSQPQINPKNTYKPTTQKFIGTKVINATPMTRGAYNQLRGWITPEGENPDDEGYLVEYTDGGKPNHRDFSGYISWSPKDVFDRLLREYLSAWLSRP